jgi:hypothetical protein
MNKIAKLLGCAVVCALAVPAAASGAGRRFIDPRQGWGPTSELYSRVVEDFSDMSGWQTVKASDKVKMRLLRLDGEHNNALRIEYDFTADTNPYCWLSMDKPSTIDILQAGRVSFWLRGEGNPNNLEIKIIDADGGNFVRFCQDRTRTSGWRKITMDTGEFAWGWGGTNKTPEGPFRLSLAISKSFHTQRGGKGWIEIADLQQSGFNPHIKLMLNQVGFAPSMNKRAVIQLLNDKTLPADPVEYSVLTYPAGDTVASGTAEKFKNYPIWPGQYWVINFDKVEKPGRYTVKASLKYGDKTLTVQSYPFTIGKHALASALSMPLFSYINYSRYPAHPKHSDPVPGGYWDTEFDVERWMTTIPVWVWGMAVWQNLASPTVSKAGFDPVDEIKYGAKYSIAMQSPAGWVHCAEKSTQPIGWEDDINAENDTWDVNLWDKGGNEIEGVYAGAMAEVYKALKVKDPALAKQSLDAGIKAWEYLGTLNLTEIQFVGMYLWAGTRLYDTTGDGKYLEQAKRSAEYLLPLQMNNKSRNPEGVYGVFFAKSDASDFGYQTKFIHSVGIYLGLMELAEALPEGDPLRTRIREAMDNFADGFLKRTTEMNPFGKVGQSLEPPKEGAKKLRICYFASDRSYTTLHGFNCDTMAYGLIAHRYAKFAGRPEFERIAVDQLSWVLGTNPGGFCMVSGVGTKNPHLYSTDVLKGPSLGAVCNGFVSHGDGITPAWITQWNSEEYWKVHSGIMLVLMSELESSK